MELFGAQTLERPDPRQRRYAPLPGELLPWQDGRSLRQPDGAQLTVLVMHSPQGLDLVRELVMSSELLPGEDPALLTGPDSVEMYPVVDVFATESGRTS